MPCYDPETHDRPIRLEAKIHMLTEMLCSLCQIVDVIDPKIIPFNPTLNDWWLRHQEFDRIGEEIRLKKEAHGMDSLTQEEKRHYWMRERNDPEAP